MDEPGLPSIAHEATVSLRNDQRPTPLRDRRTLNLKLLIKA